MRTHASSAAIATKRERLALLEEATASPTDASGRLVHRLVDELRASLRELSLAEQEIRRQGKELATLRATCRAEQVRYESLLDLMPDGYLVTDRSGIIQEANQAAARLLGTPRGSLPGRPLASFVGQCDQQSFLATLSRLVDNGAGHSCELWMRGQDGGSILAEVTVATLQRPDASLSDDQLDSPSGLYWLVRDVSDRPPMQQRLERNEREMPELVAQRTAELRDANELLRQEIDERERREGEIRQRTDDLALINSLHDAMNRGADLRETAHLMVTGLHSLFRCVGAAVYLLSDDRDYLVEQDLALSGSVIDTIESLTGAKRPRLHIPVSDSSIHTDVMRCREARLIGDRRGIQEVMLEYFEAVPGDMLRRAAHAAIPQITRLLSIRSIIVAPLVSEDEAIGLVTLAHTELMGDDDLSRLEALARQVTSAIRHGRTADALAQSEIHYHSLFEGVPVGLYRTTPAGRILDANPALVRMLGYPSREALLATNVGELYADPQERKRWQELIAQEGMLPPLEVEFCRADGTRIWVRDAARAVQDDMGRIQYYEGSIEDISDWRRAQDALVQAEKLSAANRLGASVAHEINNPLQAVIGCLGLAREAVGDPRDVSRYLEVAESELHRVVRTVARLRDLSRPVSAQERQPTDLLGLLDELLALIRPWCDEQHVEVVCRTPDQVPTLRLAADRIQQAFLNLTLNAVDAMPDGGRLEILAEVTDTPPGTVLTFGDNGGGIDSEVLPHIFEPFYTTKDEGLGLGLYVVQSTIADHGGRIEVESSVGQGSTFTVWLPA